MTTLLSSSLEDSIKTLFLDGITHWLGPGCLNPSNTDEEEETLWEG